MDICFYFQVHQPYRLRRYVYSDVGNNHDYFDEKTNGEILCKIARTCYVPTNTILCSLLRDHPEFKITFSFSGIVLDQFAAYCPAVLESFQELLATGQVSLLAETYYHSLACLYNDDEFEEHVALHGKKINDLFGMQPTILRNTELIYHNSISEFAQKKGYKGVLMEGADHILAGRTPHVLYRAQHSDMPLILKEYKLSDDIAFRFSDKGWSEYPLTVEKYCQWIESHNNKGATINLFMDYETFGEHQWAESGIFDFLRALPGALLRNGHSFVFPDELVQKYTPCETLDVPHFVSWADNERDVSAWLGNSMQQKAAQKLYELAPYIQQSSDELLREDWRKLQTSDHFYYMCTKWFNDGDIHTYFSPYESPYQAFINFMNVYNDLAQRVGL